MPTKQDVIAPTAAKSATGDEAMVDAASEGATTSAPSKKVETPSSPGRALLMGRPETRILRSGKKQKRRRSRESGDDDDGDTDEKRFKMTDASVTGDKEKEDADKKEAASPKVIEVEAATQATTACTLTPIQAAAPEAATSHAHPQTRPAAGIAPTLAMLKPMVLELPSQHQQDERDANVGLTPTMVTTQTRKAVTTLKHLTRGTEVVMEEETKELSLLLAPSLPAVQTPHRDQLFQKMAGLYATPAREGVLSALQPSPPQQQQEEKKDGLVAGASSIPAEAVPAPAAMDPQVVSLLQEKQQKRTTKKSNEVTQVEVSITETLSFFSKHKKIVFLVTSLLAVAVVVTRTYIVPPTINSLAVKSGVGLDIMKGSVDPSSNTLFSLLDEMPEIKMDTETVEGEDSDEDEGKKAREEKLLLDIKHDLEHAKGDEIPKIIYHESEEKPLVDDLNKKVHEGNPVADAITNIEEEKPPSKCKEDPRLSELAVEAELEQAPEPVEGGVLQDPSDTADDPENPPEDEATENKEELVKLTFTDEEVKSEAEQRLKDEALQEQYQTEMNSIEAVQTMMNRVRKVDAEGNQKNGTLDDIESLANDVAAEEAELQMIEEAMGEAEEALQSLLTNTELQGPVLVKLANDKIDALNELSPSVDIPKVVDATQVKLPGNTPDCGLHKNIKLPSTFVSTEAQGDATQYLKKCDIDSTSKTMHEWADELVVVKTQRQSEGSLASVKHWLQAEYQIICDRLLAAVDTETSSSPLGVRPVEYSALSSATSSDDSVDGEDQSQDEGVSREKVEASISEKLRLYVADGTGQLDYAASLHGASVIRGKTSPSFADSLPPVSRMLHYAGLRFYGHPPEQALSRVDPPGTLGQCWAFRESQAIDLSSLPGVKEGEYATLTVKLAKPVHVASVTLEHPLSTDTDTSKTHSAVKSFRIYGYQDPSAEQEPFLLGEFMFNAKSTKSLQEFAVTTTSDKGGKRSMPPFAAVTLAIDSNWGHDYACLYRFRVHSSS